MACANAAENHLVPRSQSALGFTAAWAARNGHLHILEYNVNMINIAECQWAAEKGHLDCLKYFFGTILGFENALHKNVHPRQMSSDLVGDTSTESCTCQNEKQNQNNCTRPRRRGTLKQSTTFDLFRFLTFRGGWPTTKTPRQKEALKEAALTSNGDDFVPSPLTKIADLQPGWIGDCCFRVIEESKEEEEEEDEDEKRRKQTQQHPNASSSSKQHQNSRRFRRISRRGCLWED